MISNSDDVRLIFPYKLYQLIGKFQIFVKLLQIIYQLISSYQKQLSKIAQSVGFLGRLLSSLLKIGLLLIKNGLQPLAKNVLVPLGLKAAASEAGVEVGKTP